MTLNELVSMLSQPFPVEEHEYRIVSTTRSGFWLAYYIDLRTMEQRLQEVLPAGAKVEITVESLKEMGDATVALGSMVVTLPHEEEATVYRVADAGYAQAQSAEPPKSAITDLYRRLLSHIGLGRYLYHLPKIHLSGKKDDNGRIIYDADPLDALRHAMNLKEKMEVVFYPERNRDSEEETKATTKSSGSASAQNIKEEWLDFFGVYNPDEAVDAFLEISKVTRKQAIAYMRNAEPPESDDEFPTDAQIKAHLDKVLGSRR